MKSKLSQALHSRDRNGISADAPPAREDSALHLERELHDIARESEQRNKRILLAALCEQELQLRDSAGRQEEYLLRLDAQMHLALARDREDLAHLAIERIITRRRQLARIRGRADRLARECGRLAGSIAREDAIRLPVQPLAPENDPTL